MSLNRWVVVGDRWPCQGDAVVVPASGVCWGLKSDRGDADEMNVEWEISVDPSTWRDELELDWDRDSDCDEAGLCVGEWSMLSREGRTACNGLVAGIRARGLRGMD